MNLIILILFDTILQVVIQWTMGHAVAMNNASMKDILGRE